MEEIFGFNDVIVRVTDDEIVVNKRRYTKEEYVAIAKDAAEIITRFGDKSELKAIWLDEKKRTQALEYLKSRDVFLSVVAKIMISESNWKEYDEYDVLRALIGERPLTRSERVRVFFEREQLEEIPEEEQREIKVVLEYYKEHGVKAFDIAKKIKPDLIEQLMMRFYE